MSEKVKKCHLCALISKECTSLLAPFDSEFPTYQAAVLYCTNVLLCVDEVHPQNICKECVKELITSVHFKRKCESAHTSLRKRSLEAVEEKHIIIDKTCKRKYNKRIKSEVTSTTDVVNFDKDFMNNGVKTRSKKRQNNGTKELIVDDFGEISSNYKPLSVEDELVNLKLDPSNDNLDLECFDSVKMEESQDNFDAVEILASVASCNNEDTDKLPDLGAAIDDSLFSDGTKMLQDGNNGTLTIPEEKKISRIKIVDEKLIIKKIPVATIKDLAIKNFRQRADGKFVCLLCEQVMTKSRGRFIHYRKHLGPTHCDKCNKEYHSPQQLLTHMKMVHSGRVHVCHECGKSYKSPTHLSTHMYSHTGEKPYKCPHCGRGFVSKSNLLPHIKTHLGVRDFICSVCGIGKTTRSELRFHMRIHNNTKPFKCEQCDYTAVSDYAVRRHARRHDPIKPYPCPHDGCKFAFTTAYDLKRHAEVHSKKTNYKCQHCHKGYHRRDGLRRHLVVEHDIENPFQKKGNVRNQKIEDRMEVFKTIKTMMRGRMELEDKSVVEKFFEKAGVKVQ